VRGLINSKINAVNQSDTFVISSGTSITCTIKTFDSLTNTRKHFGK
jgi:hypothetical protein